VSSIDVYLFAGPCLVRRKTVIAAVGVGGVSHDSNMSSYFTQQMVAESPNLSDRSQSSSDSVCSKDHCMFGCFKPSVFVPEAQGVNCHYFSWYRYHNIM
jgi:hypothetical protein